MRRRHAERLLKLTADALRQAGYSVVAAISRPRRRGASPFALVADDGDEDYLVLIRAITQKRSQEKQHR